MYIIIISSSTCYSGKHWEHWGFLYHAHIKCVAGVESFLPGLLSQAVGEHWGHWGSLYHAHV